MKEKGYFWVFFVVVMILLGGTATISYIGDPGRVFRSDNQELKMVNILLSGHNVTNFSANFDEGNFKELFISKDPIKRDTIIIGSSRTFEISDSMLDTLPLHKNRSFFNAGMSGGGLERQIALIECYAEKGEIPQTVILGVEDTDFQPNSIGVYYPPSLSGSLSKGLNRIGFSLSESNELGGSNLVKKYTNLISRPNFIMAIQRLLYVGIEDPTPTDESNSTKWLIMQDGRRIFPRFIRNTSPFIAENNTRDYILVDEVPIPNYKNFNELNPDRIRLFEAFVEYLRTNGTTVIFYLSPETPMLYQKFSDDPEYRMIAESENYIRRYAAEKNITVIGSYNPAPYNLTSADYYDWVHPRPEAITRIFAAGPLKG